MLYEALYCSTDEEKKKKFSFVWEYIEEKWAHESIEKQKHIFNLLCSKQIFPYSYLTDMEVLQEKRLPDLKTWNSGFILKDECTQAECDTAHMVFTELGCSNIDDYLNHYLG